MHENTEIAASDTCVYITWWTKQTGTFMPVFRASNDSGNTFGKILILSNSNSFRALFLPSLVCIEGSSNPFTLPHFLDLFTETGFHGGILPARYYQIVTCARRMF